MTQNLNAYRAAQAYRGAAVTVAPLTAVVMLFDGAILSLKRTAEASAAGRFEEGHGHLMRATAILRGLSLHLDTRKGGALAERLFKTYNGLILASHRAYGRRDAALRYQKLILALTELRDAWKSVAAPAGTVAPAALRA
ncbi:MAG: flagellar export chaperone FliS [Pseudomonadota bacterium]|jgi:flagellar protein FliS